MISTQIIDQIDLSHNMESILQIANKCNITLTEKFSQTLKWIIPLNIDNRTFDEANDGISRLDHSAGKRIEQIALINQPNKLGLFSIGKNRNLRNTIFFEELDDLQNSDRILDANHLLGGLHIPHEIA